jgi:predicted nuclease with TOPRIM domain
MKSILITCFSILSLTAYSQRDSSLLELSKKAYFDSFSNKKREITAAVAGAEYEALRVEYQKGLDMSAQLETQYKESLGLLEEMTITNAKLNELIDKKDSEISKLKEELAKYKSKKKN